MQYLFKHILIRDVAYQMQLGRRLRDLHRRAAEVIEVFYAADLSPYYADLAHHYEAAGMMAQAIDYLHKAGDHASEVYDVQRAVEYYQKALACLSEDADDMARRVLLYEGLGRMLRLQGRYSEAMAASREMLSAATALNDAAAVARAWAELSWTQNTQGNNQAALESATQAEEIARQAGDPAGLIKALTLKGWAFCRLGDPEAALALGERAVKSSRALQAERKTAAALNLLSTAHDALVQYERAIRLTEDALTIYQKLGCRQEEGIMLNNLGTTVGAFGNYSLAVIIFRDALKIAREIGDYNSEMLCLSNLGSMRVGLHDYQAAEANLRQAIEIAEAINIKFPEAYGILAEAYVGQGKLQDALAAARQALALALASQEDIGGAWRALGIVAAHFPDPIEIEGTSYDMATCFTEALRAFTEMGAEGERARTLRTWARFELAHGDRARGVKMWREARDIFERLGMIPEVERMTTGHSQ